MGGTTSGRARQPSVTDEPSESDEPSTIDEEASRQASPGLRRSIVLPAHNEAALLGSSVADLLASLRQAGGGFEILIVENGSTDGTGTIADALADANEEVHVVALPAADYGAAEAKGFEAARGEVVVYFDVDYIDMGFLTKAEAIIDSGVAGIVLASKRAPGATDRRPLSRRILTLGFTLLMRVLLKVPVSDAHGMKVLSRQQCTPAAKACRLTGSVHDVELVLRASRGGVRIAELPADVRELRPPRTPVWRRSIESAAGLLRLRLVLWHEELHRR